MPPPAMPPAEIVWWGERKGRWVSRGWSFVVRPMTEWICVASSASRRVMGGRMDGSRRASMLLPEPGGPIMAALCPPGGGDLQHPLHLLLAPHFGKIRHGQVLPLLAPGGRGGDLFPAGEMLGQLLHVLHRVDGEAFGQGRLRGAVRGDEEPLDPLSLIHI